MDWKIEDWKGLAGMALILTLFIVVALVAGCQATHGPGEAAAVVNELGGGSGTVVQTTNTTGPMGIGQHNSRVEASVEGAVAPPAANPIDGVNSNIALLHARVEEAQAERQFIQESQALVAEREAQAKDRRERSDFCISSTQGVGIDDAMQIAKACDCLVANSRENTFEFRQMCPPRVPEASLRPTSAPVSGFGGGPRPTPTPDDAASAQTQKDPFLSEAKRLIGEEAYAAESDGCRTAMADALVEWREYDDDVKRDLLSMLLSGDLESVPGIFREHFSAVDVWKCQ